MAKRSVGATQALHAYQLHLAQLLEEYDLAQRQLEQIEHELHHILERIPYSQKLLAIRGVNATSLKRSFLHQLMHSQDRQEARSIGRC